MRSCLLLLLAILFISGCIEKKEPTLDLSGKKILMIVAPTNFRDEELQTPKKIFEDSGAKVEIASKGVKVATGMLGSSVSVDLELSDADVKNYDAIVFVGGTGATIYFNDSLALKISREANEQGKIIAAICIAPSILANAGIIEGKRATAFPTEADNLRERGAIYTNELVTREGKIITARGPEAASDFANAIVESLAK